MNYFLIKGLLSLLMMGQAPVKPICIAIDKYQTPDQKFNIYLFEDVHMGHPKFIRQEQADFIAAAKEKNAFVIAEDKSHYVGEQYAVKQYIKQYFDRFDTVIPLNKIIRRYSMLIHLGRRCVDNAIPFFNAECRHEISYANSIYDEMLQNLALENLATEFRHLMLNIENDDSNWITNYCYQEFGIDYLDDKIKKINKFPSRTVNIRILYAIYNLIQQNAPQFPSELIPSKQKDAWLVKSSHQHKTTKNIFVFAGGYHTRAVIMALEKYLHATSSLTENQKKFTQNRYTMDSIERDDDIYLHTDPDNKDILDQKAQQYVDKYSVNISEFFSLEKQHEQNTQKHEQKLLDSSDLESCEEITESSEPQIVSHTTP